MPPTIAELLSVFSADADRCALTDPRAAAPRAARPLRIGLRPEVLPPVFPAGTAICVGVESVRKIQIGGNSWQPGVRHSPKASARRRAEADGRDRGRKNTTVVTYFWTMKGEPRHELLRHYSHEPLAAVLESDPRVRTWTAMAAPVYVDVDGECVPFTPDFRADERGSVRLYRVLDKDSEGKDRRRKATRDAWYDEVRASLAGTGMVLTEVTEEQLKADPYLPYARQFLVHRCWDWPEDLPLRVAVAVNQIERRTMGCLHAQLGRGEQLWYHLIALVSHGYLDVEPELNAEIGLDTEITAYWAEGFRR